MARWWLRHAHGKQLPQWGSRKNCRFSLRWTAVVAVGGNVDLDLDLDLDLRGFRESRVMREKLDDRRPQ